MKEYEEAAQETEQAVQMVIPKVFSEDPRFMEKGAPSLHDEYPKESKVFFLGEAGYASAAQVTATKESTISIVIAVRVERRRVFISSDYAQ